MLLINVIFYKVCTGELYNKRLCVERGLIMNIVVLAGGTSTERDISILTSTKVCESLRRNGYNANIVDAFFRYR